MIKSFEKMYVFKLIVYCQMKLQRKLSLRAQQNLFSLVLLWELESSYFGLPFASGSSQVRLAPFLQLNELVK